ncbi:MAG: ATP-binding protein [Vicinamibacterales bacterium]
MTMRTTLREAGTLDGLGRLLTALRSFLTVSGVTASDQRLVHAAVDELLANVILHGGAEATAGGLLAHVRCTPDEVEVELIDGGAAFDPATAPADAPHALTLGGVGIRLARHWIDDLRHERRGSHNHVTLRRRLRIAPTEETRA